MMNPAFAVQRETYSICVHEMQKQGRCLKTKLPRESGDPKNMNKAVF